MIGKIKFSEGATMFIADLHIHSRYSRATSSGCTPRCLELAARQKGILLLASGDCTHPTWRQELQQSLIPAEEGLYRLKEELREQESGVRDEEARPRFVISGEISTIYKQDGRVRKVHHVILLPSLEAAEKLALKLEALGCNLRSDGRPILGLNSRDLLELTLDSCGDAIFIPAHIWTPHFSVLGAASGFSSIEECYGDLTPHIHALETGLSSDPSMNWRLSVLDRFTLVSNSDAHSPAKLGREANFFHCELSYPALARALVKGEPGFGGTIEFFPEEGKYHLDGHRNCRVCLRPRETLAYGGLCPVCGRKLTVGVLHRTEDLADRAEHYQPPDATSFESLAPLPEVIAACQGWPVAGKKTAALYEELLRNLGTELHILREASLAELERYGGVCLAEGIRRLRDKQVRLTPGYDGLYGQVGILDSAEIAALSGQISLFGEEAAAEPEAENTTAALPSPAAGSQAEPPRCDAAGQYPYGLDREQWQAASAPGNAVAVLAGPGSGKTRTLISRIAWLLEQQHVPPEQITAVTFTHKAANQLRERLVRQFRDQKLVSCLHVGTFHSLCRDYLAQTGNRFTLLNPYQARGLAAEIIEQLGLKQSPAELLAAFSKIKTGLKEAGALAPALARYGELLKEYQALDFDDLLLQTLAAFSAEAAPGREGFGRLLVDEFQDINDTQYRLIRAWTGEQGDLFVIGDPDQAIYGFRGSDSRCFERLRRDYPQLAQYSLTRNYRSTPQITGAAAALLNRERPLVCREAGSPVRLLHPESALSEGIFIAQEIDALVGGVDMLSAHSGKKRGGQERSFSDIAVLCRTHRQTDLIEQCLDKQGIPYIVSGRDDFLDDAAVQSCLAFLRLLTGGDDPISRHLLARDLGPEQLEELYRRFRSLARKTPPADLVQAWIDACYLGEHPALERLRQTALLHKKLPGLLEALSSTAEGDISRSGGKTYQPEAVAVMTLHAAKGLEFPVVFLAGLRQGLIPFAAATGEAALAEEKRLLYVGMTRAGDQLLLLAGAPESEFLAAIPAAYTENGDALKRRRPKEKQLSLFD